MDIGFHKQPFKCYTVTFNHKPDGLARQELFLLGYSELTKTSTALARLAVLFLLSAARRLVLIFVNPLYFEWEKIRNRLPESLASQKLRCVALSGSLFADSWRLQFGSNRSLGLFGLVLVGERAHTDEEAAVALRHHEYLLAGVVGMAQAGGSLHDIVVGGFALVEAT